MLVVNKVMMRRVKTVCVLVAFISTLNLLFTMPAWAKSARVPTIKITPEDAFVGQDVKIVLQGFPPKQSVTVLVQATNSFGQTWESHAEFLTDRHGRVDLARQAPRSGTYRQADASGLLWSMSLPTGEKVKVETVGRDFKPVNTEFTATVNGQIVATATLKRSLLAPGVRKILVHDDGLRGVLFVPPGKKSYPGIIVLGGSEGGLPEVSAAYLAANGFTALALAYFNYDDLPKSLENIRLEYFKTAIGWLEARPEVRHNHIAIIGSSRGAELALVLGSTFPEIRAVVAIAPSSVVWPGFSDVQEEPHQPAWTYRGRPLPSMPLQLTPEQRREIAQLQQKPPWAVALAARILLKDKAAVNRASIPVQRINGPVLLISGDDDKMWPTTEMADMVMKRLKAAKHAFHDRHLAYPDVGHLIPLPNMPATVHEVSYSHGGADMALGGETEHTAVAARDAWGHIVRFLHVALRR